MYVHILFVVLIKARILIIPVYVTAKCHDFFRTNSEGTASITRAKSGTELGAARPPRAAARRRARWRGWRRRSLERRDHGTSAVPPTVARESSLERCRIFINLMDHEDFVIFFRFRDIFLSCVCTTKKCGFSSPGDLKKLSLPFVSFRVFETSQHFS